MPIMYDLRFAKVHIRVINQIQVMMIMMMMSAVNLPPKNWKPLTVEQQNLPRRQVSTECPAELAKYDDFKSFG